MARFHLLITLRRHGNNRLTNGIVDHRGESRGDGNAQGEDKKGSDHGWIFVDLILLRYNMTTSVNDVHDVMFTGNNKGRKLQNSLKDNGKEEPHKAPHKKKYLCFAITY